MTDQTPRTEAGRDLMMPLSGDEFASGSVSMGRIYVLRYVLAIEAEAAAQARAEALERVRALGTPHGVVFQDDVLAILAGETE